MGLFNKGQYGMFVACGIWCLADVSSVSPSSEQTAIYVRHFKNKGTQQTIKRHYM